MVQASAPRPPSPSAYGAGRAGHTLPATGDPVLSTRFAVPSVPTTFVRRPRLAQRLDDGVRKPLVIVNGPAGAGKTLCVADWLAHRPVTWPTAWLTVERGDRAPGMFWTYVLEALRHHGVTLPHEVGSPARADEVDQALLARLAAYLHGRAEPLLLVLDEFDRVPGREVADQVEFVLRHSGGGLRLILISRMEPLLPLHRRRAADEVADLRAADLAFTPQETAALLSRHGLSAEYGPARLLTERTEGWAAGIRLCALAMGQSQEPDAFLAEFGALHSTVADFLLGEVLAGQPAETQELLLRSSILERIHPRLADALTGHEDAARILAGLERANAFVTETGPSWYRLHPLFAEILRVHLRSRHPGLERDLHRRAARWLGEAGQLADALPHAAAAGDWEFAASRLVDALAIGRLFTGLDTQRLDDLLSAMPPDVPGLASDLVRAARSLARYDVTAGLEHLRRAEQAEQAGRADRRAGAGTTSWHPAPAGRDGSAGSFDRTGDGLAAGHDGQRGGDGTRDPVAVRLSLALLRVITSRLLGSADMAEVAATEAERLANAVPPHQWESRPELPALLLTSLGAAQLWAGRLDAAKETLSAAAGTPDVPATVSPRHEALGRIALIDFLRGWPGKAEATARAAVAVAERAGLPPARCSGIAHVVLAAVAVDRDALPDARAALHQAAVSAGGHTDPVVTAGVVILRSRLLLAGGDPPAALEALSEGDDRSQAGVRSPWVAARLALAAATAQLVQGHPGAALDAVKGLEGPDTAAPRIPECALIAARARIAVGQSAAAARILDALPDGPAVGPVTTVRTLLARAEIADRLGEQAAARRLAVRALDHARPEQLRRPFLEAGPWLARVLHGRQATADPWLPGAIVGHAAPTAATGAHAVVVEPLSEREQDVLRCVAEMKSTQEVADELFLSVNTVKSHLKSIFRKLSATRRGEAVRRARELDLL